MTSKKKGARAARKRTLAERADKHRLYEASVQCAEAEIDFVDATFRRLRGRRAVALREDFCGTAVTACEWVRRRRANRAIGVDLDAEVLEWGRRHHVAKLEPAQRARLGLKREDVLSCRTVPIDIVLAMNFSYWTFHERPLLRKYFRSVHRALKRDGVFFLDGFGGYEAGRELRESKEYRGFTYVWDQASYNACDARYLCHIHFRFADGSRLNRAFSYDWRLWTLPEIRELLSEAGFARVTTYFQGWDAEAGEADGEFTAADHCDADAGWICYITAEK